MENSSSIISALLQNGQFSDWYNHLSCYDKSSFEREVTSAAWKAFLDAKEKYKQRWPAKEDKLIAAKNNIKHWFSNVTASCKNLEIGRKYTVKECNVASSWCEIKLEELDGEFCLSAFDWKVC